MAWAYNEEKTLKWLEKKYNHIVDGWKTLDVSNSRLCSVSENPEQVKCKRNLNFFKLM